MPEGIWSGFWEPFLQMRAQKGLEQERQAQTARALAEQHWREAEAKHQGVLEQQAETRLGLEAQNIASEIADREARRKADEERGKRSDVQERGKRINEALTQWHNGNPIALSMSLLMPEDQDEFKQRVIDYTKADYDQRLQQTVKKHLAGVSPPNAAAQAGAVQQGAQSMAAGMATGNPLAAMLGMAGGAGQVAQPQMAREQQIAQAIWNAHDEVGEPPDEKDWMLLESPAFTLKRRQEERQAQLAVSLEQLRQSQTARNQALTAAIPEDREIKKDLLKIRQDHETTYRKAVDAKIVGDAAARRHREWYDQQRLQQGDYRLNMEKIRIALERKRTDAYVTATGARPAQQEARDARNAVRQEKGFTERELAATDKQLSTYKATVDNFRAMLKGVSPDAGPDEPVPGTKGLTKGQVIGLITAAEYELDPGNADSAAHQRNALQSKITDYRGLLGIAGPDEGAVGYMGKPFKPGESVEGAPVGKGGKLTPDVARHFLKRAGWRGGKPTDAEKRQAQEFAKEAGYK